MSGGLTQELRRKTERLLRLREKRLNQAREELDALRQEADGMRGRGSDPTGDRRQQNATGDRVGRSAMRLVEAERRMASALAWARLAEDLSRELGPGFEGVVFDLSFTEGMSDAMIARKTGKSRQAIRRARDEIVTQAAFMALDRRLLTLKDGSRNQDTQPAPVERDCPRPSRGFSAATGSRNQK